MPARKQHTCSACGSTPAVWVRERKIGAKGMMAQSFASSYYLFDGCLEILDRCGALESRGRIYGGRIERADVKARSFAWLKNRATYAGA